MKKESIITAITFVVLIAAFATGIFFLVRLANGPGGGEKESGILSGEKKTYTHPDYGFSFDYPANFTVGNFAEGDGETTLVQSADGKSGFQIFVSPYDESEPLSKNVILRSAPDMKIANDKEIEIGQDKIKDLSFDSEDASGKTREIWFVKNGNLYQVTSYLEFGNSMEKILESLRFD